VVATNMRLWLGLLLFMPSAAVAQGVKIQVEYVLKQERVKPEPKIVRPLISHHYVLRQNGTVDESFHTGGKFPEDQKSASKLGSKIRVVDDRTIKRTWRVGAQTRELTITTVGTSCVAKLEIRNPAGEFKSFSTDLNTSALYRNSEVESTKCKIE
jgi:hypothetical protein